MINPTTISTTATTNLDTPLPSPAPQSGSSDGNMTPLTAIFYLIVLIAIPSLIYAFFFALKCPQNPFDRRRQSSSQPANELKSKTENLEMVSTRKYTKEMSESDYGSECPVCLSVFVEGEEIKQLSSCKHTFHVSCIDMWLRSHSNCPVCRASVPVKRAERPAVGGGEEDLRHGLPDAASLV